MTWLNGYRMLLVLVGVVAAMVFGGVNAKADFTFGEPTNLGPTVNTASGWQAEPSISADGLSLYFVSNRSGGSGDSDLWVTTRPKTDDGWGPPVNLGPVVNSSVAERGPCISADGLELYFVSKRSGKWNIHVSTRPSTDDEWAAPVTIANTPSWGVDSASVSGNGLELYYSFYYNTGWYEVHVMKRATTNDAWGVGVRLGPNVNHWNNDLAPSISADGLTLFYALGGGGGSIYDLWMTTRPSTSEPWGPSVNLISKGFNSSDWDYGPSISNDGSILYFESDRPGSIGDADIWQVPIIPIVDFNGDGIVDAADMCIMIDHWGTNESLCDIGPMPWGDGIVDVQDLIVLAEHLFDEVFPIELIAYWKLDEVEGIVAHNIVGDKDGFLLGDPVWRPVEGKRDGALEFDGIDDHIISDSVLNPTDGPFSVFAWIKGGAPGQVIISQADGAGTGEIWLGMTASDGSLMTGLVPPPRGRSIPQPLQSQSVITDGQWHHVGFVWDGAYRSLYVDGTEIARDTQALTLAPLKYSDGGLYIGASKDLDIASFFSGLIDDVRIYNKALSAEQIAALAQ